MVRIDMRNTVTAPSASRNYRHATRYCGSERGGIRQNTCARIRIGAAADEVEKASPYLMTCSAGFRRGLVDGRARQESYLPDAIVIMTSNLGSERFKKFEKPLGFGTKTASDFRIVKNEVMKAAETRFSPEFRNASMRSLVCAVDDGRSTADCRAL